MILHQFSLEGCRAYLIGDKVAGEAALVDPRADQVAVYLDELKERGLRLVAVIETHTHADHLSGAAELKRTSGAAVYVSAAAESSVATKRVSDGDTITVGSVNLRVLASPGHTDDSLSLHVGDALLSGDALLIGGAGRTDFQNGSPQDLHETLFRRFAALPDNTVVWPGHDYQGRSHTTLGEERRGNPLFALVERDRFVAALTAQSQPRPADMDVILLENRRGVRATRAITPDALSALMRSSAAPLIVDVRMPFEHRSAHIDPCLLMPLDDIERRAIELPTDRDLVLVCRTGSRARIAAGKLTTHRVSVLEGGIEAWRSAGHALLEGKAHMSLERQVRVVAGGMAATGGILALAISPWWALLPSAVGLGLVFAGVTDRCGMALVLGRMPWNKVEAEPQAGGGCAAPTCAAPINVPGRP